MVLKTGSKSPSELEVTRSTSGLNVRNLTAYHHLLRRTADVENALSTGSWMLLSTIPPMIAMTIAALQAMIKAFISRAPL
jgi:hypothetical protein